MQQVLYPPLELSCKIDNRAHVTSHIFSIILAGGSGTRLWPLSRRSKPKQLLSLTDGQSLLQETAKRLLKRTPPDQVFTITQDQCFVEVQSQLKDVQADLTKKIFSEPLIKNTLPAISWMVAKIAEQDPKALVSVFPADHVITRQEPFLQVWDLAVREAEQAQAVLLGIKPTYPSSEYGYIRVEDQPVATEGSAFPVHSFVEKPTFEKAQEYVQSGLYYWNSGIFVFQAGKFLDLLKKKQPQYDQAAKAICRAQSSEQVEEIYRALPSLSIDCGLLEQAEGLVVVPADMGWTDLGSWEAIYDFHTKDVHKNVIKGDVLEHGSYHNLLVSEKGVLAVLGVENLVVVQTSDATLVAHKDQVSKLKKLYQQVQDKHPQLTDIAGREMRPWGWFEVLFQEDRLKVKRITVKPHQKLSLQAHQHRSENWVLVSGQALVTCGDSVVKLEKNQSIFIPQGAKHRVENATETPVEIIEVQTGSYLGEDDIVRFDDDYGRA